MPELDTVSTITETDPASGGDGKGATSTAVGSEGSTKASPVLPGYITDQLKKETREALLKEMEADPDLVKELPKDPTEVFERWRSLRKESKSAIKVPKQGDPQEVWARYYKAIGRPESPEGYVFERPTLPEGMRYNEDFEKWARAQFHDLGVPASTAAEIIKRYNTLQLAGWKVLSENRAKVTAEAEAKKKAEYANGETVLRQSWGGAYNERVAGVRQMLREGKVIPAKWVEKITKAGLDNDPDTLFVLDQMRRYTREDRKIGLEGEVSETVNPEENIDPKTGRHVIRHKRKLKAEEVG